MSTRRPPKPANTPPDTIIREIPLIERYSRHNEADDYRFREFLKFRLNRSTKEMDDVVRRTTDEVWARIDCTTCANCCRTLHVVVDAADIARLAGRLRNTAAHFERKYVVMSEDGTKELRNSPCVFLGSDNRCTVYEDRPKACRDFPYLHENHFSSRSLMMISNTSVCPIVFNVWQALKDKFGFRRARR